MRPESPLQGGTPENPELTYVFTCAKGTATKYIPDKHAPCTHGGRGYFIRSSASSGPGYDILHLTYARKLPTTGHTALKEAKEQFRCETTTIDRELKEHKNYKKCWDHYIATKGTAVSYPEDYQDKDVEHDFTDEDEIRWLYKDDPLPGNEWVKRTKPLKPKLDRWMFPQTVVVETIHYQRQQDAEDMLQSVGKTKSPKETFGYSGEWLVVSSITYESGDYWVCETHYYNREEWDSDVYS